MKTIYSILLLIYPLYTRAQALVVDSTRFITGLRCCTDIEFAIPTADKGIFFVGFDGDNPGGIIPYFSIDTGVYTNVLMGKIDSNQNISWIKVYGGSKDDNAEYACQTPDGGYVVIGTTLSNDGDVTGNKGNGDIWLLRVNDSGILLWEKCYGSAEFDGGMSVANTPDHGFVLLGETDGYDGDVPFHYGSETNYDWLVVKTDSMGNKQWSKDLGGTNDEGYPGCILAVDSGYYLIGYSNSTDHDCTDNVWHPGVNTGFDYYILKLNDTGKVLWDSSYGGSQDDEPKYAIFDARDSTIVINGLTYSNDYMVTGNHGEDDFWVTKINKNGKLIWEKTLGGGDEDAGYGLCMFPGGYLAIGSTITATGREDCALYALGPVGDSITKTIFGGIYDDQPNSILPYKDIYVAAGWSVSNSFLQGSTYGNFDSVGGGFVSYLDYWPLAVKNISSYSELITIYPNPTYDNITIVTPQDINGVILFFNSIGKEVYYQKIDQRNNNNNINVKSWKSGLYIIKWQGDDGSIQTTRFIKY